MEQRGGGKVKREIVSCVRVAAAALVLAPVHGQAGVKGGTGGSGGIGGVAHLPGRWST